MKLLDDRSKLKETVEAFLEYFYEEEMLEKDDIFEDEYFFKEMFETLYIEKNPSIALHFGRKVAEKGKYLKDLKPTTITNYFKYLVTICYVDFVYSTNWLNKIISCEKNNLKCENIKRYEVVDGELKEYPVKDTTNLAVISKMLWTRIMYDKYRK